MMMPSVFGRDIFDDFMDGFAFPDVSKELYGKHAKNVMKTDVRELDNGYEIIVDLPGFKKDEIEVQLEDGYLTISAAKGLDKDETDKKGNYIRQERYTGSMSRSLTFMVSSRMVSCSWMFLRRKPRQLKPRSGFPLKDNR